MDNKKARELFYNIDDIFKKLNIPYFLACGTALGFHRNKGFIGHDKDMDFGVFIEDYDSNIIEEFLKNDFAFDLRALLKAVI